MMELAESYTLARQLTENVVGKRIKSVVAGASSHRFTFYSGDPQLYSELLEGKVLSQVRALSGQLELVVSGIQSPAEPTQPVRLVFNDGTNLRYLLPGQKQPAKHQLLLVFSDESALICTVQMYGGIHLYQEGEPLNEYYILARDSISPLNEEFDEAYFQKLWTSVKGNTSAKAFLATEQRIPGLGNGLLQDILFHGGIHPKSKLENLSEEEQGRLFRSLKDTLKTMVGQGGRDTEKDLFGKPGGYGCVLSKNTLAQPCPRCGSAILREAYLGGNVYYCPVCQPLKK